MSYVDKIHGTVSTTAIKQDFFILNLLRAQSNNAMFRGDVLDACKEADIMQAKTITGEVVLTPAKRTLLRLHEAGLVIAEWVNMQHWYKLTDAGFEITQNYGICDWCEYVIYPERIAFWGGPTLCEPCAMCCAKCGSKANEIIDSQSRLCDTCKDLHLQHPAHAEAIIKDVLADAAAQMDTNPKRALQQFTNAIQKTRVKQEDIDAIQRQTRQ